MTNSDQSGNSYQVDFYQTVTVVGTNNVPSICPYKPGDGQACTTMQSTLLYIQEPVAPAKATLLPVMPDIH